MPRRIYLDYAAATPVCDAAVCAMKDVAWANPSGLHTEGLKAKEELEKARTSIALFLQCRAHEVTFFSGGTEVNNFAVLSPLESLFEQGVAYSAMHVVVAAFEHPSILEPVRILEKRGVRVSRVMPDECGHITPDAVRDALTKDTKLVSVAWVQGELGVLQDITAIARAVKAYNEDIVVHTDMAQGPLYMYPYVHALGVDMATLDSGKLYGPRGVGVLYHGAVALVPTMRGGGQEAGLRSGTENLAALVGCAAALGYVAEVRVAEKKRIEALKALLVDGLKKWDPECVVFGNQGIAHTVSVAVPGIDAEYTLFALDAAGIAVSTKSSCKEGQEKESEVVRMLSGPAWRARSTLRLSLGLYTTAQDVHDALERMTIVFEKVRSVQSA
jgi:cysteine desulfurase